MDKPFTLIYILGSGHCGSTLLNLLLNGHSQILGLSEIRSIHRYVSSAGNSKPVLNPEVIHTPFWRDVKQCYEIKAGQSLASINLHHTSRNKVLIWSEAECIRQTRADRYLLACVAEKSGANFIVDASKTWQRCYLLWKSGLFNLKVIHLVRDGRAIVNSYISKYNSFGFGLRYWVSSSLWAFYLRRKFTAGDWLQIQYEQLAQNPESTLQAICAFLNVSYESEMLSYRKHPYVGLVGNRMMLAQDEKIFLDERWKLELSRSHQISFDLLCGWLNKYFGY